MLPVKVRRVFLAQHRVDFRKGADGLLGEAYRLGADPYSGDCVVFIIAADPANCRPTRARLRVRAPKANKQRIGQKNKKSGSGLAG